MLDLCVHAADLSTATRPFDVLKRWTFLLFEEFFLQGDLEKQEQIPV
jgi:hypothetical protein